MGTLANLPTGNTLKHKHVASMNFKPADFNFYQTKPVYTDMSSLDRNLLSGCFHFIDYHQSVENTDVTLNDGDILKNVTFECWVKVDNNASSNNYLLTYSKNNTYLRLYNPGALTVRTAIGTMNTTVDLRDGLWHHIAVVCQDGQPIRLYCDTAAVFSSNTVTYTGSYQLQDGGTFLAGNYSVSNSSDWLNNGYLGQIRIWNTARTLTEIVFNAGRYLMPAEEEGLALYWGDQYDSTSNTLITDSSGQGNDGTVNTHSETFWDTTERFGALLDDAHLVPHPTNMSGSLSIPAAGDLFVSTFGGSLNGILTGDTDITIEAWVKPVSETPATGGLFEYYPFADEHEYIALYNPTNLTVHSDSFGSATSGINILDGHWHHVALVRTDESITLYVDTVAATLTGFDSTPTVLPLSDSSAFKAGTSHVNGTHNTVGESSEWRFWRSARTREEIIADASFRLLDAPTDLLVYWSFARSFEGQNAIEDFSQYHNDGYIQGNLLWENDTIFGLLNQGYTVPAEAEPSASAGAPESQWQYGQVDLAAALSGGTVVAGAADGFPNLTIDQLEQSFNTAQGTGYFDPIVFPNIYLAEQEDNARAKDCIADLTFTVFENHWVAGRRLSIYTNEDGTFDYEFIPIPEGYGPTISLMYTLKTTSFFGEVGEGQVVRTFSLMPGESTYASISTYKNTSMNADQSSSVLDSVSQEAQDSFQAELEGELGLKASTQLAFALHGAAEGREGIIVESMKVSGTADASGSASLTGTLSILGKALAKHSEQRSASRNVEVDTSYTVTSESGKETSITREFKNINNSTTLDILFRQMNQEYVVAHYCSDIHITYYDPRPGSYRKVRLYQLDDLLDQVLIDNADTKLSYKQIIINEVYKINQFAITGINGNFIEARDKMTGVVIDWSSIITDNVIQATPDQQYFVNTSASTTISTTEDSTAQVQGLLMRRDSLVMRTDNVVADVVLGAGVGLDTYAQGLQQAAVKRENVENKRIEVENGRVAAGLAILEKARNDGADAKTLAELYFAIFRQTPPNKTVVFKDGSEAEDLMIS